MKPKKILVAIDLARTGGNDLILEVARDLGRDAGAEVTLLYVVETIPKHIAVQLPAGTLKNTKDEAEQDVQNLVAKNGFSHGLVRQGVPKSEILSLAGEIGAELIVMHSHDPGLADYVLGSVAGRVVRHAHCSVYIVRVPD